MTPDLDEIKEQYADLLVMQYKSSERARSTIKLLIGSLLCDGMPFQLFDCFDLETAGGEQLTIIGKIVGVPRGIFSADISRNNFAYASYDGTDPMKGYGRYNNTPVPGNPRHRYNQVVYYVLSDEELRFLIKLKIIRNSQLATFKAIEEAIYEFFNGVVRLASDEDFTLAYEAPSQYENILTLANALDILPRPMGMQTSITYS